ncbi:MAG: hypothetical protein COT74_11675 [Bdellovibrionales bacterium CG10_big_fil_rev_8_21_14_0_10_45_34]|nr:MAG: hypothetical protein COT74_11675 [Bdellovibrionales bacterium CG10_big_fil_rev_8_21_14_0_10_45_34]
MVQSFSHLDRRVKQKGYEFVYEGFVRIWLSALFIVFVKPLAEWVGFVGTAEIWFNFYGFGFSYLVVSWFFLLAQYQNQDLKEKYEAYRMRKRIKDAEKKAKLMNDHRHRPD